MSPVDVIGPPPNGTLRVQTRLVHDKRVDVTVEIIGDLPEGVTIGEIAEAVLPYDREKLPEAWARLMARA
jgi:hypothetical protein